ncbi:hypothetical protein ABBQ38_015126 [Trebouxia sp. C0009 RCD-2024]
MVRSCDLPSATDQRTLNHTRSLITARVITGTHYLHQPVIQTHEIETWRVRLRGIKRREDAVATDAQLAQQRTESLEERERQIVCRERQVVRKEVAVKQQADQIAEQHAVVQQLQIELLNQYNTVVASLPRLEDRLQAARQLLPEGAPATSGWQDPSTVAETSLSPAPSQAQRQPVSSLPAQQGICDQLPDAPRTAQHNVNNRHAAALPETNADVSRGEATEADRATSQRTDGPCFSVHAGVPHAKAIPETAGAAMAGTLPATTSSQHMPQASPEQLNAHLATGDSRPDSQSAAFRSKSDDEVDLPSLAVPCQEAPPTVPQPRCAADNSSSRGAGPSCQGAPSLCQDHKSALVLSSPGQPGASCQQPANVSHGPSQVRVMARSDVPGGHSHVSVDKLTTTNVRPEKAGADVVQSKKRTNRQAASDAQVLGSAGAPGMAKPRPGLRSQADIPVSSDKARMAALARPELAHGKQNGAECGRSGQDVACGSSSRGAGRGRAFGRGGRRGRARSALFRTSYSEPQPAGDLDEAVQALKATAEGMTPAACTTGGESILEDDELKPSFMRRVSSDRSPPAKEPAAHDPNPRPVTRRRTEATRNAAQPAKAKAAMQEEVPDLLKILQQKGLADRVDLLDLCDPTSQDNVYSEMHNILSRFCEGKMGSWQGRNVTGRGVVLESEDSGKHEYCLLALEHLLERAEAYSLNSEPVRWGWCRELSSFVFVFANANRVVVEKPCYGHATYFFDLEEPLPVSSQVQRLIAVLSVPGVSRRKLLEDSSLDPGPQLTAQERKQLEAAGWKPGTTVRSLLNFTGDRIFHQSAEIMTGQKLIQRDVPDYKNKIAKVLSEGASGGRVTKSL